jgi:hypothetical protein
MQRVWIVGSIFCFLVGSVVHAQQTQPRREGQKFELKLTPAKVEKGDSELLKLQKERYNSAVEMVQLHLLRIETGRDSMAGIGQSLDRAVQSFLDLESTSKEKQDLFAETVRFAKHVEEIVKRQQSAGFLSQSDVALARYVRLTAEIRLLKEKEGEKK